MAIFTPWPKLLKGHFTEPNVDLGSFPSATSHAKCVQHRIVVWFPLKPIDRKKGIELSPKNNWTQKLKFSTHIYLHSTHIYTYLFYDTSWTQFLSSSGPSSSKAASPSSTSGQAVSRKVNVANLKCFEVKSERNLLVSKRTFLQSAWGASLGTRKLMVFQLLRSHNGSTFKCCRCGHAHLSPKKPGSKTRRVPKIRKPNK